MWSTRKISEWADCRSTSDEIAKAILEYVEFDEDTAQDVWQNGCTPDVEAIILKRAWELADAETDQLYWGIGDPIERPRQ